MAWNFSVNPASCENNQFYQDHLRFDALLQQCQGLSTTHALIDDSAQRLMGFVSLRMSSIISRSERGDYMGSPALEIFVLAVAEQYEGRGVGRLLVDWVIRQAAY